ncbi:hypothetical protein [Xanthobacter sp.]|uniref:hypothetical protein n=1 Tax=Xanthobacter sp. TaxID=35809 RepID=UPI0025DF040F|nr:hypothetical protein [Xanthobacter sp.]
MWVRFLRAFRWDPPERRGNTTIVYPAGAVLFVRRICAEAAVASGAAVITTRPGGPRT